MLTIFFPIFRAHTTYLLCNFCLISLYINYLLYYIFHFKIFLFFFLDAPAALSPPPAKSVNVSQIPGGWVIRWKAGNKSDAHMGDVSYYSVEKRKGSQGEASANWKTIIGFVDKDEKSYMSK